MVRKQTVDDALGTHIVINGGNVNTNRAPVGTLGTVPGDFNFDNVKSVINVRNNFPNSILQVGQEMYIFCINNTAGLINEGEVVRVTGFDTTNDAFEITKALCDVVDGVPIGMATTNFSIGGIGLVTMIGRVNNLDTTSFSAGDVVYCSDTIPGAVTSTKPAIPVQMGIVGKIDATNGFINMGIKELEKSIYGVFNDLSDQTYTVDTDTPIEFDNNGEFSGITHSESVDNDEFTFPNKGVYKFTIEPQFDRSAGSGGEINIWIQKDTGGGFVNIPNTNIKLTAGATNETSVAPLTTTVRVEAADKIRFILRTSTADLFLNFTAASGSVPGTPSVIMNIDRIGD